MTFTRRNFLVGGLRVSALVPFLPELSLAGDFGPGENDPILVVLQLTGGNDGLNTVVPHRQDAYYRMRPFLGQKRDALHRLDDEHGLHPSMGALGELYGEGRVAVVHGVGNPNPDRSHFRSLEIWHTADPTGPAGEVGWLGRMADQIVKKSPGTMPALAVDQGNLPLSMRGLDILTPTVRDPQGFKTNEASRPIATLRDQLLVEGGGGDIGFLRDAARTTYATAERMREIADEPSNVEYPEHLLAQQFKLVAQLVRGKFGTRVYHLSFGGFDTHSRQAPVHADRLDKVSGALAAFQRDLEHHGAADRVVTLVFSEFGRRAAENASKGTDHGRGAPVFVIGSKVRGGLFGTPPDLDRLVDGDIENTTDFRSVYTMLERDWMGLEPSSAVKSIGLMG